MMTTISLSTDVAAALRQALNDAVLVVEPGDNVPPPTATPPAPPSSVPPYLAPIGFARLRKQITTEATWAKGAPSFYSHVALNDSNVWLIGFTAGVEQVTISGAEFAGPSTPRVWALVDNETGATIASNAGIAPTPTFSVPLNGTPSRFNARYVLTPGRRYTLAVCNAQLGASSGMVGQFYF